MDAEEMNIISYSEIVSWDSCQRLHHYRYDLNYRPVEESEPIDIGGKGHKLLQSFYEGMRDGLSKEESHKRVHDRAQQLIKNEAIGDFNLMKAWLLVDRYIQDTDFTTEALLVEERFLFPVAKLSDDPLLADVHIGFTPDIVFKRKGGFVDVEDSKFVQRAWPLTKIEKFTQSKFYAALLRRMGYNVSTAGMRFFNVETSKVTTKAYPTKAAEETILLRDYVKAIKEVISHRNLTTAEKSETRKTSNYNQCGGCFFKLPCGIEAEGKDATKTFKNLYMQSDYDYSK